MTNEEIRRQQLILCREYGQKCLIPEPESKLGFAITTQGLPLNGLRHPPEADTNGWYIWRGEELNSDPDFFAPLHTSHLVNYSPEAMRFLGLPPGYRFLCAGDYVDVWFDESLLSLDSIE